MAPTLSLAAASVSYRYTRSATPALTNFSAEFSRGLTLLLGPNGAGKTTFLQVVAGMLRPATGTVTLQQQNHVVDCSARQFKVQIGYMPQHPSFVQGFSAKDHLLYCAWLSGMPNEQACQQADAWLDRVGLLNAASTRCSALSGGMQRRLAIASAAIADPPVLLLDEPTVGLDPAQRARFRETLLNLKEERIILMSSHQVDDLLGLVDWVVIVLDGHPIFHGSFETLLEHGHEHGDLVFRVESAYANVINEENR